MAGGHSFGDSFLQVDPSSESQPTDEPSPLTLLYREIFGTLAQHLIDSHDIGPRHLALCVNRDSLIIEIIFPSDPTPIGLLYDTANTFLIRLKDLSLSPFLAINDFKESLLSHLQEDDSSASLDLYLITLQTSEDPTQARAEVRDEDFHSANDGEQSSEELEMVEEELLGTETKSVEEVEGLAAS